MSTADTAESGRHPDPPTGPIAAVAGDPFADTARHRLIENTGGPGTTRVVDAAVEKLAAHAVSEVDQVGGAASRILGVSMGADGADRSPKVDARVDGAVVTLAVRLSVNYPAPVGQVTRAVRGHVVERLATLAGLDARRVDITVAALIPPSAPVRRLA